MTTQNRQMMIPLDIMVSTVLGRGEQYNDAFSVRRPATSAVATRLAQICLLD